MIVVILELCLWFLRFMTGACIFSFLNVVVCRLPAGESIAKGRSHCMNCGKTLTAKELVPCFSYLFQRGKCTECKSKISGRDFGVEVLGGTVFVCCGRFLGCGTTGLLSMKGFWAFLYLCILIVVALIDWDTKIIYDRFHIMIMCLGVTAIWLYPDCTIAERLIGAIVISLPMLMLALWIAGAFGGGDIKLMAVSGFLLGWKAIVCAMFLALLFGGIYCCYMLATHKLNQKDSFAFGPFLAFGLAIALFVGEKLTDFYLSLF